MEERSIWEEGKTFSWFERFLLGIGIAALVALLSVAATVFSGDELYGIAERVVFVFISGAVLLLTVAYALTCVHLQASKGKCARLKLKGRMLRANTETLLLNPNLNLDQRNLIKKNIRLIDSDGDPFSGESRYQHTDHYKDGEEMVLEMPPFRGSVEDSSKLMGEPWEDAVARS